jgi:hypothetical protein
MAAGAPADVAVAGTIVAAVGELLLASSAGGYVTALLLPSTLAAVGMGAATVPLTAVATKRPPLGYEAVVSGVVNTSRQVGGAIGIAALGTVATAFDRHTAFVLGATLMLASAVVARAGIASHGRRSRAARSRRPGSARIAAFRARSEAQAVALRLGCTPKQRAPGSSLGSCAKRRPKTRCSVSCASTMRCGASPP